MRRLPIFLVQDVSESMAGENLMQLEQGIGKLVSNLRQDPTALETVYLGAIAFAGIARTLSPLVELAEFRPPPLPMGSGTALGAALNHVMDVIDAQVMRPDANRKGDWAPIVYLFTDGKPTDRIEAARSRWQRDYARSASLVAIAIGRYADQETLRSLTEHVVVFDDRVAGGFEIFIKWLTNSISSQSQRVGAQEKPTVSLAKTDDHALALAGSPHALAASSDPDCVVLVGRCQFTRRPYLLKYDRESVPFAYNGQTHEACGFQIAGCFPLTEEYFDWSAGPGGGGTVSTADLAGVAPCPHCGSPVTIAQCGCGKLMCLRGAGPATCPWCDAKVNFAPTEGADFDLERRLG